METRKLGSLDVSVAGLGANNFGMRIDHDQSIAVIHAALDAGITFFDTAELYGGGRSEEWLGEALDGHRADVVIATKFGWAGAARRDEVAAAVEQSLRRLRTDHIDLVYCHRPHPETPFEETLAAVGALVEAGKVREFGCSNVHRNDITTAVGTAERLGLPRLVCIEEQYNLLYRRPEEELIPACTTFGLSFVPFFPLANGLLTGKYSVGAPPPEGSRLAWTLERVRAAGNGDTAARDDPRAALQAAMDWHPHDRFEVNLDHVSQLEDLAKQSGRSMVELALGWLAAQPTVPSVIAGATSPAQVTANAAAVQCGLTADELAEVTRITG